MLSTTAFGWYTSLLLSIYIPHNIVNTFGMFHITLCACQIAKQKVCIWVSRVGLCVVLVLPCTSDGVQWGCFVALSSEVYNQTSVITNRFTTSSNSRHWLHFTTHWILFKAKHTSPNVEYCTEKHVTTLRCSRCTEWMSTIRWPKLAGERWTASLSYVDHGPKLWSGNETSKLVSLSKNQIASLIGRELSGRTTSTGECWQQQVGGTSTYCCLENYSCMALQ